MNIETIAVNGGLNPKDSQNAISPPIYQTTAFEFESIEHVSNLFDLKEEGHIYTRTSNPKTSIIDIEPVILFVVNTCSPK